MRRIDVSARWLAVLLGSGVVLVWFGALLDPESVLAARDVPMFHLPLRLAAATLARAGLPLWNPLISGGQPILSNPNYALFYPPTWLAFVLPAHYAIGLEVVLHAAWAFAGAWFLARRVGCRPASAGFAAIAFVGGGGFATLPHNLTLFCGAAWLPWLLAWGHVALLATDRRERVGGAVLAATALAFQLLSGEPYSPVLGGLAIGCLLLLGGGSASWATRACRLAAIVALATLLGAAQLLPTLARLPDSPRSETLSSRQTMTWSTRPGRLIELAFPTLRGDPSRGAPGSFFGRDRHDQGSAYLPSIYVGQLVLVFAASALLRARVPLRGVWVAMLVVGAALAFGRHNPLYAGVLVHIPPWSLLRYPEKFLLLATTGVAFAAALGWEHLLARRDAGDLRAVSAAAIPAAVLTSGAGLFVVLAFFAPDLALSLADATETLDDSTAGARLALAGRESAIAFALASCAAGIVLLHRSRRTPFAMLATLVLALVFFDLHRVTHRWVTTARVADLTQPPAAIGMLPEPSARVWTDQLFFPDSRPERFDLEPASSIPIAFVPGREQLLPYWANLWGLAYALNEDYDLTATTAARHALETFRTRTRLTEAGWSDLAMTYLGAWNVCNVVRRRSPEALRDELARTGRRPPRVRVLENPFCLDRYRFTPLAQIHPDLATAADAAQRQGFDVKGREHVVHAAEASERTRRFATDARVVKVSDTGARIDLEWTASGEALLVVANTFDDGWHAEVDGRSVPVRETAIGQMAVALPADGSTLVLRYRDRWVLVGCVVSALAAIASAALLLINRRRTPAPAAPPPPPS